MLRVAYCLAVHFIVNYMSKFLMLKVVEMVDASTLDQPGFEPIAGLENQSMLKVFNKVDLCQDLKDKKHHSNDAVYISLKTGEGFKKRSFF